MCGTKQKKRDGSRFPSPPKVLKKKEKKRRKQKERNRRLIVGQSPFFVSFECYTCSCFSLFFFYPLKTNKQTKNTPTKETPSFYISARNEYKMCKTRKDNYS